MTSGLDALLTVRSPFKGTLTSDERETKHLVLVIGDAVIVQPLDSSNQPLFQSWPCLLRSRRSGSAWRGVDESCQFGARFWLSGTYRQTVYAPAWTGLVMIT